MSRVAAQWTTTTTEATTAATGPTARSTPTAEATSVSPAADRANGGRPADDDHDGVDYRRHGQHHKLDAHSRNRVIRVRR